MIVLTPLHKIRYQSKVSFLSTLLYYKIPLDLISALSPIYYFANNQRFSLPVVITQPPNINMFTTRLCMEV